VAKISSHIDKNLTLIYYLDTLILSLLAEPKAVKAYKGAQIFDEPLCLSRPNLKVKPLPVNPAVE
jgi:hypothetical protein